MSAARLTDPGERAVRFFNQLTHTGDYSGQPFRLRPWQEGPIRKLFGTLRPDGTRQYRTCFEALPRKQGKTEKVAAGGLYLMMGQGRANQRIFTGAGDKDQASLIFDAACEMIANDPELSSLTEIYRGYRRIDFPAGRSFLQVLSSVPKTKHGLGPTAVLLDEFHVIDEELVNVLTTGFGARRDPLTWKITTAGWDRHSICYDEWQYAIKVRDGVIDDPTYLPVIFAAEPGDDWTDEATWRKAMPALGDFCNLDFIREECKKAKERPRFENTFRQLYLNQWTEQSVRWISLDRWDACGARPVDPSRLNGAACYGGLDLSQTRDLTAWVLAFPDGRGGFEVLPRFWAPEEGAWRDERHNRELYRLWAAKGHLTLTPGEVIDYGLVEAQIAADSNRYGLRKVLADRAMALHLCLRLRDAHGIEVEFLPQTPMGLNSPIREVERLVLAGKLSHGAHPVLRWNVANASTRENSTGLLTLDKARSTGRIDGLAALVNAIAAASASGGDDGPSVYETRGILVI
jgi:phage terminase large subunit-like protein